MLIIVIALLKLLGANIGAFTVLAGYLGAKKVIGVEPISTSYGHLLNNVERAGLTNVVALKNIVSDVSGNFCDVSLNENSGHNSMYNVSERFETIETITLHEILAQLDSNNIMLKLDCEGAEYDILLKASLEDMNRISEVIVEIHSELHPVHKGFEIIDNKLLEFGFKQADAKQVFFWTYDQSGNLIDCKPIPFRIEIWKR